VHESLRTYLKREVPPERVWQALEAAMLGNNESARVSASRVLMDALHEPEQDEDRARQAALAASDARAHLARELERRARSVKKRELKDILDELALELEQEALDEHPDLVGRIPTSSEAAEILHGLEEVGLLVRPHRVEELAEQKAQERRQP
jgi:hypothetical protein